ncbi:MAG: sodium/proline symporter [Planctomycetota bacterium]|nr:sodium/proline symporter [Planctomycetota bacterium]
MEEYRAWIILGCVAAFFAMCIAVGLWAMRKTKSASDFFMAGRDLGFIVTAVAVFSSTMSGFGFVGGPGLVYQMGMSSAWMIVCTGLSYTVCFFLLAKRLRILAEVRESISLPDAVQARYGSRLAGFLTAVAILLGVLGYLGTQILAMATVMQQVLAGVLPVEMSLPVCAFISVGLLVFYCVTGGIIASVYTDLAQGLIMMIAALLVFFAVIASVEGGFAGMSETILQDDKGAMSPWGTKGMFGALSWYFVFSLGIAGQPHVITKFMMSRKVEDARYTLPVTVFGFATTALLWLGIGLAMRALVLQGKHPSLEQADGAAAAFLQSYAHPLLAGVVFAGLFAAIMSTADSFLNIGAAAIVHDIPRAIRKRSLKHELFWARVATVAIACVATVFALYSGDLVALLGAFGWGTFAAALVPTVAIGFNWKRATPTAACVAIASSLIINFGLKVSGVEVPYSIDSGAIALLVSLTLFLTISFLSPPPKLDSDIEAVLDF